MIKINLGYLRSRPSTTLEEEVRIRLIAIRHGKDDRESESLLPSWFKRAHTLGGSLLNGQHIDVVIISDLLRTMETATALLRGGQVNAKRLTVRVIVGLMELYRADQMRPALRDCFNETELEDGATVLLVCHEPNIRALGKICGVDISIGNLSGFELDYDTDSGTATFVQRIDAPEAEA